MLLLLFAALAGLTHSDTEKTVHFKIDDSQKRIAISPYIYGTNQPDWNGTAKYLPLTRIGGNRWTAYNWENNASNAGNDYMFQNDGYLGGGDTPDEAVRTHVAPALNAGAAIIVTVPMAGYVSADKLGNGDVNKTPDYLHRRFFQSLSRKGSPFTYPPDTTDKVVYQDEFVAWLEKTFPQQAGRCRLFYSLDNEPDLWDSTHARLRTAKLTYAEILQRSIATSRSIKAVAPDSLIFGPVSYGWAGYQTLQGAPDAQGRNYLDFYLAGMKDAEKTGDKRLLDVLDVHWYPEARGGGKRITEGGNAAEVVRARLQAPRSLWDPTYREDSWITRDSLHEPIRLIPRLQSQIEKNYPGTRLSITEYNYGGGNHISGGVAEADVLGIFGREGVFAAAFWELSKDESYVYGGLAMYRNYDGKGGHFGNTSISAQTDDAEKTSVYAGIDAANPNRMIVVALNKTEGPCKTEISIASKSRFRRASLYRLTAETAMPRSDGEIAIAPGNRAQVSLPAMSVTTMVLEP